MKVYQGKPKLVLLSTSIGARRRRANVLDTAVRSGQFFGYDVKASLAIPSFHDNFDPATTRLTNAELDDQAPGSAVHVEPRAPDRRSMTAPSAGAHVIDRAELTGEQIER